MKPLITQSVLSILSLFLLSCGPKAPFVWIESLPQTDRAAAPYKIQPGDSIDVSVWNQEQISGTYIVRSDGYITVPLVGDLLVAGETTTQASKMITDKLEGDIVQNVKVTVISTGTAPKYVTVLGEVGAPSQIVLKTGDTLVDAIAMAGGLTEFADKDSIYVYRQDARFPRIRFDYDRLTTSKRGGIGFKLRDGDVIVVE